MLWWLTPPSPSLCNDAPIWRVDTVVLLASTFSQRLAGYPARYRLTPVAKPIKAKSSNQSWWTCFKAWMPPSVTNGRLRLPRLSEPPTLQTLVNDYEVPASVLTSPRHFLSYPNRCHVELGHQSHRDAARWSVGLFTRAPPKRCR